MLGYKFCRLLHVYQRLLSTFLFNEMCNIMYFYCKLRRTWVCFWTFISIHKEYISIQFDDDVLKSIYEWSERAVVNMSNNC